MTPYVGSGPYCYANALCTVADPSWPPGLVETLTGSPFGFQMVGPLPLFDPPGWDPDLGLDQALSLLGWRCERETFSDGAEAYERLRRLSGAGPVFVGPLEMGLLGHRPGAGRPLGADHFVTVLDANTEGVTMHDPHGHPYAWLPRSDFLLSWASDTIGYGSGAFPLRSGFRPVAERSMERALLELLPHALRWAAPEPDPSRTDSAAALRALGRAASAGLGDPAMPVLEHFSLRLGARRRADAAWFLAPWPALSDVLDRQARVLGRAQLATVRRDGESLATAFDTAADLHDEMVTVLPRVG